MDQFKQTFMQEASELLTQLEILLLELEKKPKDQELVHKIYRTLHTIKGSGAMFGFDNIASFTHEIENLFELIKKDELSVSKIIINISLSSIDVIKIMLEETENNEDNDFELKNLITKIREITPSNLSDVENNEDTKNDENEKIESIYRIRFAPDKNIFLNGTNIDLLFNELKELGKCNISAYVEKIPLLKDINEEFCYTYWDIILTTTHNINKIYDVFIFVQDNCKLKIDLLHENFDLSQPASLTEKLGEILVERGDITEEKLDEIIEEKKLTGEILVEKGLVSKEKIKSALTEQQHIKEIKENQLKIVQQNTIRIPSDKLDKMVDLVGELVTSQARLGQISTNIKSPELISISEETERLIWDLRDTTMNIRMLPIGTTFNRFRRLVRDLSAEMGKEIEMTTEGAETELDKTILDQLNDPLVHLIRNSIDHGIEKPDKRIMHKKNRAGTIHLAAIHSGTNVLIKITDDGKGLNPEQIRQKAIDRGLISPNAELSDKEIFMQIFEPGFSTAEKITNVSGRGVGMDVVKKAIDALRGNVEIESKQNIGTTVTLKLPLTLAIIEGMLVEIGDDLFIIPVPSIVGVVEFTDKDVTKADDHDMIRIRGEIIPFINLRDLLKIDSQREHGEQIVLINIENKKVGFLVDTIIGKHQTVIKSLGKVYKDAKGISGATILGNGDIALILDPDQLIRISKEEEKKDRKNTKEKIHS